MDFTIEDTTGYLSPGGDVFFFFVRHDTKPKKQKWEIVLAPDSESAIRAYLEFYNVLERNAERCTVVPMMCEVDVLPSEFTLRYVVCPVIKKWPKIE